MPTTAFRSFARSFGAKMFTNQRMGYWCKENIVVFGLTFEYTDESLHSKNDSEQSTLRFGEKPVRTHLINVYACLTVSMVAAAVGAYVHVFTNFLSAGIFTALGATGLLLALMYTQDNGKNHTLRMSYLVGFAFFTGLGIGPLLEYVIHVDSSIIPTAFLASTLVFTSFSLSAIFAERGKWLYLGGTLMSLLSVLMLMSLANLFLGSDLIFKGYLYLGLALMSGFVLYDTQLIMEKRRAGDKDFIAHSVDLFVDFVGVFRRLLIILAQKEQGSSKKRKD